MKKLYLILLFVHIISSGISAQGSKKAELTFPRRVVMEEFTGTWCGNCPRGMIGISRLRREARLYRHNNNPQQQGHTGQEPPLCRCSAHRQDYGQDSECRLCGDTALRHVSNRDDCRHAACRRQDLQPARTAGNTPRQQGNIHQKRKESFGKININTNN